MGASDFSKLPHIGESLKRKEDYRFLTGAGQYTDDVVLAAQSHAVFVRSPHAHAKINSINVEAAKAAPGVLGVFTGADVAADTINGLPDYNAQILVFFVITVAAAEVAVGLALIVALFRKRGTVQSDALTTLRD